MEQGPDRRPIILAAFAVIAAVIVGAILISRAGGGESAEKASCTKPPGPVAKSANRTKPKVEVPDCEPPTTLVANELEKGTGAVAKPGDEVTVQYVGVGFDSEEEFDASWGREPFTFTLGAGEVIPGWEQGVEGMKVDGRRELVIPADLAYGPSGSPPTIGPNETLVFVIDLLKVK